MFSEAKLKSMIDRRTKAFFSAAADADNGIEEERAPRRHGCKSVNPFTEYRNKVMLG